MALGDGIRRDIAKVSDEERNRFISAIVKLDTTKFFPDGVSYWDKQEEIHKNAHFAGVDVHRGPAFIPWHRVIVNRLEQLLREVDPALSLHYWDWTTDPRSTAGGRAVLFSPVFMGNASGGAGHLLNNFESTENAEKGNGHTKIWREVGVSRANANGTPAISTDASILTGTDFQSFGSALKSAHDSVAHSYIGGTISDPHYSFHDPFVFLLHSNLDRLWAKWQTDPAHPDRLSPATAYNGLTPAQLTTLAIEHVEPWAGGTGLEPWASDPATRAVITYMNASVVAPRYYDTNHTYLYWTGDFTGAGKVRFSSGSTTGIGGWELSRATRSASRGLAIPLDSVTSPMERIRRGSATSPARARPRFYSTTWATGIGGWEPSQATRSASRRPVQRPSG